MININKINQDNSNNNNNNNSTRIYTYMTSTAAIEQKKCGEIIHLCEREKKISRKKRRTYVRSGEQTNEQSCETGFTNDVSEKKEEEGNNFLRIWEKREREMFRIGLNIRILCANT